MINRLSIKSTRINISQISIRIDSTGNTVDNSSKISISKISISTSTVKKQ